MNFKFTITKPKKKIKTVTIAMPKTTKVTQIFLSLAKSLYIQIYNQFAICAVQNAFMDVACQLNCIEYSVVQSIFKALMLLFRFYVRFVLARRLTQTRQMIRIWIDVKLYTMALNPSYATSLRCFFFYSSRWKKNREKNASVWGSKQHSDIVFTLT